ncbi:MAG: hypothetical protein Ct9H300mP14_12240 [Gammaproteobacteria bacterium]|nr:MAG: hypothetical protein Ct9H300mP14_12240 [Gammaproteobacteria bacterium]
MQANRGSIYRKPLFFLTQSARTARLQAQTEFYQNGKISVTSQGSPRRDDRQTYYLAEWPIGRPLSDLRFVVKDLFDVAGSNRGRQPRLARNKAAPQVHAVIVSEL